MRVQDVEICLSLALVCSQLYVFQVNRSSILCRIEIFTARSVATLVELVHCHLQFHEPLGLSVKSELLAFTFIGGVLKLTLDFQKNWAGFTSDHPCITSTVYILNTCAVSSENRRKSER